MITLAVTCEKEVGRWLQLLTCTEHDGALNYVLAAALKAGATYHQIETVLLQLVAKGGNAGSWAADNLLLRDPGALPPEVLCELLKEESPRVQLADQLANGNEAALDALKNLLRSPLDACDARSLVLVAGLLVNHIEQNGSVRRLLYARLRRGQVQARALALESLCEVPPIERFFPLLFLLLEKSEGLAEAAAKVLAAWKVPFSIVQPFLERNLRFRNGNIPKPALVLLSAYASVPWVVQRCCDLLRMEMPGEWPRDLLLPLTASDDPRAKASLLMLARSDDLKSVQRACWALLSKLEDKEVLDELLHITRRSDLPRSITQGLVRAGKGNLRIFQELDALAASPERPCYDRELIASVLSEMKIGPEFPLSEVTDRLTPDVRGERRKMLLKLLAQRSSEALEYFIEAARDGDDQIAWLGVHTLGGHLERKEVLFTVAEALNHCDSAVANEAYSMLSSCADQLDSLDPLWEVWEVHNNCAILPLILSEVMQWHRRKSIGSES